MTLQQALILAAQSLGANRNIENPSFESEVLLRHILQINRAQLFLEKEQQLPLDKEQLFLRLIERCLQGEPAAYIIQRREFYGLDFYVDPRVLIPRPETELLVEEALDFAKNHFMLTIADIGTGSGAIAISLAVKLLISPFPHPVILERSEESQGGVTPLLQAPVTPDPKLINNNVKIYATDISTSALEVARLNCEKHHVTENIKLLQGDLLDPLPRPVDILIANLPYVSTADFALMPSARYEPSQALDGGESGLDQIFRLCRQIEGKVKPGGCVLLEIGMGQGQSVKDYLQILFKDTLIEIIPDLAGIERVLKMRLTKTGN